MCVKRSRVFAMLPRGSVQASLRGDALSPHRTRVLGRRMAARSSSSAGPPSPEEQLSLTGVHPSLQAPLPAQRGRTRARAGQTARSRPPALKRRRTDPEALAQLRLVAAQEARSLVEGSDNTEPPLTVLENAAVGPGTLRLYNDLLDEFLKETLGGRRFARRRPKVADVQCLSHVRWMISEKRSAADGMYEVHCVDRPFLPRVQQEERALAPSTARPPGFSKSMPSGSRVPPPNEAVSAIAVELSVEGERDMAVATLVGHSAYLRPEELFSLRCQDVLEPASTTGVYCHWTLLLGPLETRKPTKTGVFDDCVILDHPSLQWLGSHLRRLKNGKEPHEIIWPFARDRYAQRFKAVV